jgi:hypothetical protein
MKALFGLGAAGVVMAFAGVEGLTAGILTLAALVAVGCWIASGWLVD